MNEIRFLYKNSAGRESDRTVRNWKEIGYYIEGFCQSANAFRTFRKDRVVKWLDHSESGLQSPYMAAPPRIEKIIDDRWDVLFTCFPETQKAEMERKAAAAGLNVRRIVTNNLKILCIGPSKRNAVAKIERARERMAYILSQDEFLRFIETGEMQDHSADEVV